MNPLRRLELRHADWHVNVLPELGGGLGSLRWREAPILRDAAPDLDFTRDVRQCANYPLVPYSNRMAWARMHWRGDTFKLARNFGNSPHALHGVGWQTPWQVAQADSRSITLSFAHTPSGAATRVWPFAFEAEQHFYFEENAFVQSILLRNVDTCDMPAGIGFHPYFARRPGMSLTFASAGAWATGADELPRKRVSGGGWDFHMGKALETVHVDHDFFGWNGRAEITEPSRCITLEADPIFCHLVVFTPQGRDYFAIEPVSHRRNAINEPNGVDLGLVVLQPGANMQGAIRYTVTPI